jgi:hypothetical protein
MRQGPGRSQHLSGVAIDELAPRHGPDQLPLLPEQTQTPQYWDHHLSLETLAARAQFLFETACGFLEE